jgi:hypothetical protein
MAHQWLGHKMMVAAHGNPIIFYQFEDIQ